MRKKLLAVLVILALGLFIVALVIFNRHLGFPQQVEPSEPVDKSSFLLFKKEEWWGPCPPEGEPCQQSIELYLTGELILEGNKNRREELDKNVVDKIREKIKSTGIMNKQCPKPEGLLLDYNAAYTLQVDGYKKQIIYPRCEKELREIEEVVPYTKFN